jgi:hypothetical protein
LELRLRWLIDPAKGGASMRRILKLAAISVALTLNFGTSYAQNMPTPKPEDAEKNAFETPTAGKNVQDAPGDTKAGPKATNPESRMNDDPPPQEKVGAPNTAPK